MRGKPQRKTPTLSYTRRPSWAAAEEASPLAPGPPLTPGPSGHLEAAPTPGQGDLPEHAVLQAANLNIKELRTSLRDISEPGNTVEVEQDEDEFYDAYEVSDTEHPEVSDIKAPPEDGDTEATPDSSQQAGYQDPMVAALRGKLDALKNDIAVKTQTVRNYLTKDSATNSSKRQATLHLDHLCNMVTEHKEMAYTYYTKLPPEGREAEQTRLNTYMATL